MNIKFKLDSYGVNEEHFNKRLHEVKASKPIYLLVWNMFWYASYVLAVELILVYVMTLIYRFMMQNPEMYRVELLLDTINMLKFSVLFVFGSVLILGIVKVVLVEYYKRTDVRLVYFSDNLKMLTKNK